MSALRRYQCLKNFSSESPAAQEREKETNEKNDGFIVSFMAI